jgi:hypothetical protein
MSNIKYTFESIEQEALKYKSRGEFQRLSVRYYRAAYDRDILEQVCSHMPRHISMSGKNNPTFKWSDEKLTEEASKYNTRKEFLKNNRSAYFTAQARGILNNISSHMIRLIREDWTYEELKAEALKYGTRVDFYRKSSNAYTAAKKRYILDDICTHMRQSCGVSSYEKELKEALSLVYSSVRKLRKSKIQIYDKPHIKGFDIDIYVPELKLGIEFDGTYHHSFDGLKRARPHWSDEDIKNYHKLKDDYFLNNYDIKILHISEKDWLINKQECIKRCLEFLGGK